MSRAVVFDAGTAAARTQIISYPIPHLFASSKNEVLVQFLAAPINRVDLMLLDGQYPIRPKHHFENKLVPGFDGCGVVLASTSPGFSKGDMVIPRDLGLGTWRTHAVLPAGSLIGLPAATPPLAGALLRSGALIAWLLLHEVRALQEGDAVIVSAGTSTVAWFLVQLARLRHVSVFLVVRDRDPDELKDVRERLLGLGAAAVISESELRASLAGEAPTPACLPVRPTMALDSVFGPVGQLLVETLAPGGPLSWLACWVDTGLISRSIRDISSTGSCLFSLSGAQNL
ncbi:putative secondary metabolism biosynthetic enzyme [Cytospora paraplurivora]|uniref:Secondary metabolism biosynthetic enzyme n=1 Tax=Cytospora paraplurivora TaxID=2898453 RepID=A0AAN9UA49_9PEZI